MKYITAVVSNYLFFVLNTFLFLVMTPIAIHVMGEEFYGQWSILNAFMLFFGIGTLGMTSIVNKFASEAGNSSDDIDAILTTGGITLIAMAAITSGILFLISSWIATKTTSDLEGQRQFNQALQITAASLFPLFLGRIPYGYLLSRLNYTIARLSDLFVNAAFWIGGTVIAIYIKNLAVIAAWNFIVQLIGFVYLLCMVNKYHVWRWRLSPITFKRMLNFSAFSFLESLAVLLFQQFDRILVGITLGPASAGVYSVSTGVGGRLSIITGQATDVMIPYASRKESLKDHHQLHDTFRKLSKSISLLISVVASILILWMNEILSVWISPEYAKKYALVFRIVVLSYAVLSLSRPAHQTLTGIGKIKFTSLVYTLASLVMLCLVYLLSNKYGLKGAAIANTCMAILLLFNFSVNKIYRKGSMWRDTATDLSLGIILPILSLGAFYLINPTILRVFISLIVLSICGIVIIKDRYLHTQILLLIKRARIPLLPII